MIDEEEGYKTFEVTIVGPVYKQVSFDAPAFY